MRETDRQHLARVKAWWRKSLGLTFREYRCHARVTNENHFPLYRQCGRCYGYGRAGLYCHQHATKPDNK